MLIQSVRAKPAPLPALLDSRTKSPPGLRISRPGKQELLQAQPICTLCFQVFPEGPK